VADGRITPIGTDLNEEASALGRRAICRGDRPKPYGWGWKFGRFDRDVWVTDLTTGERKLVLTKVRHYFGPNPAGTRLGWSDGKDFWTLDLASGKKTNLTARSLPRARRISSTTTTITRTMCRRSSTRPAGRRTAAAGQRHLRRLESGPRRQRRAAA
jgi:hypothetical protein